jgi:hypothetical protein
VVVVAVVAVPGVATTNRVATMEERMALVFMVIGFSSVLFWMSFCFMRSSRKENSLSVRFVSPSACHSFNRSRLKLALTSDF